MEFHFLIASERSGSNLITKMMDAHPDVCGPSPLHILRVMGTAYYRYGDLSNSNNWHALLDDVYLMLKSNFAQWRIIVGRKGLERMAKPGDLPTLLREIFKAEATVHNKKAIFIKELWAYQYSAFLEWCFPDAKYVYLVRDPRDVALSWRKNPIHSGGIVAASRQWQIDQHASLLLFKPLEDQGRATLVRYEDLISDSERALTKICKFLGIEYSPKMLEFHENRLTKKNAESNQLWGNLAKEVISDNFNKFKNELGPFEIAVCEKFCQSAMEYFGYKLETDLETLERVTGAHIARLKAEEGSHKIKTKDAPVHDIIQLRLLRSHQVHQDCTAGSD